MVERFIAKQSFTGRRSSVNKERHYWAYRTGIELTPWSTDEEVTRFEKRKRELMELDAKEQDEVKQASTPVEEVSNANSEDGREPAIDTPEANPGKRIDDNNSNRRRYPRAAALLDRKRDSSATNCGEDRVNEPV